MYKFYMPQKIKSNIQGTNSLIRIYNKLIDVEDNDIILNFTNTTWISGEMIALLGAVAYSLTNKYKKTISIEKCSDNIENLFKSNGFCEVISNMENGNVIESAVKFKYFKEELDSGNTDCFSQYLNNEFFPKLSLKREEIVYITSYLSEVFINARTHGDTNEIFCCGQKYPELKKIRFMIVDLGVGIPSNVRKITSLSDCESIKWSIEKGNTTKDLNLDIGGLGLYTVQQFINDHNGDLSIVSYQGQYNYKTNISLDLPFLFKGTIVYIDFDYTMLQNVDGMFKLIKNDKNDWNF